MSSVSERKAMAGVFLASILIMVSIIGFITITDDQTVSGDSMTYALTINDTVDGSFDVSGHSSTTEDGKYVCPEDTIITITYVPEITNGVRTWTSNSDTVGGMNIVKRTAFGLSFTLTSDVSITPSLYGNPTKVSTWSGLIEAVSGDYDCIIVDTGTALADMSANQLTINRSVDIIGKNDAGSNGFKRTAVPMKGLVYLPSLIVGSGCTVNISGVTFDGGAKWTTGDSDDLTRRAESTLQRGTDNSGIGSSSPFIRNNGTLYLLDGTIIQNAYNDFDTYTVDGGDYYGNPGGAFINTGAMVLDGVMIKDCYAVRGSAVFCTGSNVSITSKGNTVITHNGGIGCELGSAIYSASSGISIEGGKFNENCGAFTLVSSGSMTFKSGEICRNIHIPLPKGNNNSQDQGCYSGVAYMFNSSSFKMEGGFIQDNVTINRDTTSGLYCGIVFQTTGTMEISGGTLCDNVVSYSDRTEVECDVVFGLKSFETGTIKMTGGSLESVFGRGNIYNDSVQMTVASGQLELGYMSGVSGSFVVMRSIAVYSSVDKSTLVTDRGVVVSSVVDSSYSVISGYGLTDVVTNNDGKIFTIDTTIDKAYGDALVQLKGDPVINGDPIIGNTLTVIFAQTPNITYGWYRMTGSSPDPTVDTSLSSATAYVITESDFGHPIYVVVTGTNGYTGSRQSDTVSAYIVYTIRYNTPDSLTLVEDTTLKYTGEQSTITITSDKIEKDNWIFIGWKAPGDNGRLFKPGATVDLNSVFGSEATVTLTETWAQDTTVYWVDGVNVEIDEGNFITYTIPKPSAGKVFVGWKGEDGKVYATGQELSRDGKVLSLDAMFIDETYHGTLTIGPVQA